MAFIDSWREAHIKKTTQDWVNEHAKELHVS